MVEQEGQTKESNRQLAMEQKALLQDLFRAKNRPDPFAAQNGEIYVIAKEVIDKWRSFVRYVCFHFCSVRESTGLSDALQWPCVVVPCRTFSLLDGVVFLLDLSQVGPHADERLMDRVLCFVPALLSSCCPAFFLFFSVCVYLLGPLFFLSFSALFGVVFWVFLLRI